MNGVSRHSLVSVRLKLCGHSINISGECRLSCIGCIVGYSQQVALYFESSRVAQRRYRPSGPPRGLRINNQSSALDPENLSRTYHLVRIFRAFLQVSNLLNGRHVSLNRARGAEPVPTFTCARPNMGLRNHVQGLIRTLETLRDQLTKEDFDSESDVLRR